MRNESVTVRKVDDVDVQKLRKLWDSGLPIMEIASELGVSYKRVQYVARWMNLRRRTQKDVDQGKKRNVDPTPEEIAAACRSFLEPLSESDRCERRGGYLYR